MMLICSGPKPQGSQKLFIYLLTLLTIAAEKAMLMSFSFAAPEVQLSDKFDVNRISASLTSISDQWIDDNHSG